MYIYIFVLCAHHGTICFPSCRSRPVTEHNILHPYIPYQGHPFRKDPNQNPPELSTPTLLKWIQTTPLARGVLCRTHAPTPQKKKPWCHKDCKGASSSPIISSMEIQEPSAHVPPSLSRTQSDSTIYAAASPHKQNQRGKVHCKHATGSTTYNTTYNTGKNESFAKLQFGFLQDLLPLEIDRLAFSEAVVQVQLP